MTIPDPVRPTVRDLPPRQQDALAGLTLMNLAALPDLLVTAVRAARGRQGVQLGPTLVGAGVAAAAPRLIRYGSGRRDRVGRLLIAGAVVAPAVLPAVAVHPVTVLGRGSPWWSLVVGGSVRATWAGLVALVSVRWLRARRAAPPAAG